MSQILTYRMWQVHNRHIAFRKFQKPTYGCWGNFTHGRHLSQEFDLTMSQRRFFPQQRYRSWHCHVAINRLNINAISTFHLFNFIRRYLEVPLKKLKGISSIWHIVARDYRRSFIWHIEEIYILCDIHVLCISLQGYWTKSLYRIWEYPLR